MLTVDDFGRIRRAHRDGMSIRAIARTYGHSRRSVRNAIRQAEPTSYTLKTNRAAPRLGAFHGLIDQILADDELAPPKQRHTAMQVFRRLCAEHGYSGGYDQVRRYVGRRRRRHHQTFIPLSHDPGQRIEADFGHVYVDYPEGRRQVPVFLTTWSYSHARFAMAMPTERTEAILAGVVEAFTFFDCLSREVWIDNPTTVATAILKGRERRLNDRYAALASHYAFEPFCCMPRSGWEKPDVEHSVFNLQRRWATPVPRMRDNDELNTYLLKCTREVNSIRGLVIIEDVHNNPDGLYTFLSHLRSHSRTRILLTCRPQGDAWATERLWGNQKPTTLSLESFDDRDDIIAHLSKCHPDVSLTDHNHFRIKSVSGKNLWLLAYAVEGYADARGHGDARSWIIDRVDYELEQLGDVNALSPEALVSISRLYRADILTAEIYLRHALGFTRDILNQLVKSGEVTRIKTGEDAVYYGLPHSALAKVYWEYGSAYRNTYMPTDFQRFVEDYANSGARNALEVFLRSGGLSPENVKRLERRFDLVEIIAREPSLQMLLCWLWYSQCHDWHNENMIDVLLSKLDVGASSSDVAACLSCCYICKPMLGHALWSGMDKQRVSAWFVEGDDRNFDQAGLLLVDRELTRDIAKHVSTDDMATALSRSEKSVDLLGSILQLVCIDRKYGRAVWTSVRRNCERIENTFWDQLDPIGVCLRIAQIRAIDPMIGRELWDIMKETVAKEMAGYIDLRCVGICVQILGGIEEGAWRSLWDESKLSRLGEMLQVGPGVDEPDSCSEEQLWGVRLLCEQSKGVVSLCREKETVRYSREQIVASARCLARIHCVDSMIGEQLLNRLKGDTKVECSLFIKEVNDVKKRRRVRDGCRSTFNSDTHAADSRRRFAEDIVKMGVGVGSRDAVDIATCTPPHKLQVSLNIRCGFLVSRGATYLS